MVFNVTHDFHKNCHFIEDLLLRTMSGTIDSLIQSSSTIDHKLEWIPCSKITEIKSTPTDAIYYASRKQSSMMVVFMKP